MNSACCRLPTITVATMLILIAGIARAATSTWNGGGGATTNWTLPANWGGTAPVESNDLAFAGNIGLVNTNDFPANTQFNDLTFLSGAGAFTLNGNPINLGGDITNNSANLQTINLNVALIQTTVVDAASNNISIGGVISGVSGLTKTGPGTLTLTASNNYTGITTVNGGVLSLVSGRFYANLNWNNSTIRLSNGGVLEVASWSDGGSQTTGGLGQLAFTTGNLQINGGTVRYSANSADTGAHDRGFTIGPNGATLDANSGFAAFSLVDIGRAGYGITSSSTGTLTLTGIRNGLLNLILGGSGGLVKAGIGTWTLAASNTYSGSTTISNGTLALSLANSISNTPAIYLTSNTATLDVSAVTFHLLNGQSVMGAGKVYGNFITDTGSSLFPGGSNSIGSLTFTNSGTPALTNNGTLFIDVTTSNSDLLVIQGDLAHGPASTLAFPNLPHLNKSAPYTIVSYTGTNIGFFAQINGLSPGWTLRDDLDNKRILLYAPPDGSVISIR